MTRRFRALGGLGLLLAGSAALLTLLDSPHIQPPSAGAYEIPARLLEQFKTATVYIKVEIGGQGGSGSGFLIRTAGTDGYIATNAHVVSPPEELLAPQVGPDGKPRPAPKMTVTVVFRSGTPTEKAVPAEVVAVDASRDLALLKVSMKFDNPPKPINLALKSATRETMTVHPIGFPFGQRLAGEGERNPAVTVGTVTVSTLRLDAAGKVDRVQLDGTLNPGNSGGPVLDATGKLVGVVVSGIPGSGIGFAIPPEHLTTFLDGGIGLPSMRLVRVAGGTAEVEVRVPVWDPFDKAKYRNHELLYMPAPKDAKKPTPVKPGQYPQIHSQVTRAALKKSSDGPFYTATIKLTGAVGTQVPYLFQGTVLAGPAKGAAVFAEPTLKMVDFTDGAEKPNRADDDREFVLVVGPDGRPKVVRRPGGAPRPSEPPSGADLQKRRPIPNSDPAAVPGLALEPGHRTRKPVRAPTGIVDPWLLTYKNVKQIRKVCHSRDGRNLVMLSADGFLMHLAAGQPDHVQFTLPQGTWIDVICSQNADYIVALADSGVAFYLDYIQGRSFTTRAHSPRNAIVANPNFDRLYDCGRYQLSDGKVVAVIGTQALPNYQPLKDTICFPLRDDIHSMAISPDGNRLGLGFKNTVVIVYDLPTKSIFTQYGREPRENITNTGVITALAFSPDGKSLFCGDSEGYLDFLTVAKDTHPQGSKSVHPGGVTSIAFSPDGGTVATAGRDGKINFWTNTSPPKHIATLPDLHTEAVTSLSFNPDGRTLVSVGLDGRVQISFLK